MRGLVPALAISLLLWSTIGWGTIRVIHHVAPGFVKISGRHSRRYEAVIDLFGILTAVSLIDRSKVA